MAKIASILENRQAYVMERIRKYKSDGEEMMIREELENDKKV